MKRRMQLVRKQRIWREVEEEMSRGWKLWPEWVVEVALLWILEGAWSRGSRYGLA